MAELAYAHPACARGSRVKTSGGPPGGAARCGAGAEADVAGATATAAVDFAAGRSVNSASGLLFGVTLPIPADRFSPLQPRFWRYSDDSSPSSQS